MRRDHGVRRELVARPVLVTAEVGVADRPAPERHRAVAAVRDPHPLAVRPVDPGGVPLHLDRERARLRRAGLAARGRVPDADAVDRRLLGERAVTGRSRPTPGRWGTAARGALGRLRRRVDPAAAALDLDRAAQPGASVADRAAARLLSRSLTVLRLTMFSSATVAPHAGAPAAVAAVVEELHRLDPGEADELARPEAAALLDPRLDGVAVVAEAHLRGPDQALRPLLLTEHARNPLACAAGLNASALRRTRSPANRQT